jgi:hypothetical protein
MGELEFAGAPQGVHLDAEAARMDEQARKVFTVIHVDFLIWSAINRLMQEGRHTSTFIRP